MTEEIFIMPSMAGFRNVSEDKPISDETSNSKNYSNDRGPLISRRKPRTIFTKNQISALKCIFDHKKYITQEEGLQISRKIGIPYKAVTIWFQNRRNYLKRSANDECNNLGYNEYINTVLMKSHTPISQEDLQVYFFNYRKIK